MVFLEKAVKYIDPKNPKFLTYPDGAQAFLSEYAIKIAIDHKSLYLLDIALLNGANITDKIIKYAMTQDTLFYNRLKVFAKHDFLYDKTSNTFPNLYDYDNDFLNLSLYPNARYNGSTLLHEYAEKITRKYMFVEDRFYDLAMHFIKKLNFTNINILNSKLYYFPD